ncbi:MAG TPA: threonine--tRNA ligase, partial [Clostridia bacterium]|nr:threonine--tRNA ligase [Clostridia bacterium]
MSNHKEMLAGMLQQSVAELFSGQRMNHEVTENGFFSDFDVSEPLTPKKIAALSDRLRSLRIPCAYELGGFSGAYLDGDASKKMLQRIYVLAFETQAELDAYKDRMQKAAEHDHKKFGAQLGLFSTSDEIGTGLVLWHPKGAIIRYLLERFSQSAHILNDYQWAYTPHIGRAQLWKTSGHLDFYKDSMYRPIDIDGEEYYLKPMNCPFHFVIYNSETRSYRDLPIRMAE